MKVKIIGCGSIGNHYANVFINRGHKVYVTDKDPKALKRMKEFIYPNRYGSWDDRINLLAEDNYKKNYDLVFIGTPPLSHLSEANKILKKNNAKIIHIEKPVSLINDKNLLTFNRLRKNSNIRILNGYNLNNSKPIKKVLELIKINNLGKIIYLNCDIREHWEGIFNAHPWIKNKNSTYLTNIKKGGGALLEHSHGISYWMFLSSMLKNGRIKKVKSHINIIKTKNSFYDNLSTLLVESDTGLVGKITQDVITKPEKKNIELIFKNSSITLINNFKQNEDRIIFFDFQNNKLKKFKFKKTRADDFVGMVKNIENIYKNDTLNYESSIDFGLDIIKVIKMAFESNKKNNYQIIKY